MLLLMNTSFGRSDQGVGVVVKVMDSIFSLFLHDRYIVIEG